VKTQNSKLRTQNFPALPAWDGVKRGVFSLSSPSLERGYALGKGSTVGLLHLGDDIFDCFGHQAREGKIFRPVDRVSETLNEWRRQRDRNPLVLRRGRRQQRMMHSIEDEVISGEWVLLHICI